MSCIPRLLELKGNQDYLLFADDGAIEGGGFYKGFPYLITFVGLGHRCGYVAIPPHFESIVDECPGDFDVHGGVTFYDEHKIIKSLLDIPCSDKWIGFDAAHHDDKFDYDLTKKVFKKYHNHDFDFGNDFFSSFTQGTHRTYEYMEDECRSLINQIVQRIRNELEV